MPSLSSTTERDTSTNLYPLRTTFRGREKELGLLDQMLRSGKRLVTLTGAGGTGKTRLARRFAEKSLEETPNRFPGGIWHVDLTEARNQENLLESTADVLGAGHDRDLEVNLGWVIAARGSVLIVFDNFEQLDTACGRTLVNWLDRAPEAAFLVTSRHRLRLIEEHLLEVAPLHVPSASSTTREETGHCDAVALFLDRARALTPDYFPTDDELSAIAQIVRKLDGLPLAIELAASRMRVLSPEGILDRLTCRFDLLRQDTGELATHQATLEKTLGWSWNLLSPTEQSVLAQLSVFRGGFSIEAAEAVVDLSTQESSATVLDVIQDLRDKSLVATQQKTRNAPKVRFCLLQSLKEYVMKRLDELGQRRAVERRHSQHFAARARQWHQSTTYEGEAEILIHLTLERENLRAVLERFLRASQSVIGTTDTADLGFSELPSATDEALSVLLVLNPTLSGCGQLDTFFSSVERLVDIASRKGDGSEVLLVELLITYGQALRASNRLADSKTQLESALARARSLNCERLIGRALYGLGSIQFDNAQWKEARTTVKSAISTFEKCREPILQAKAIQLLGAIHQDRGQLQEAAAHYQQVLRIVEPYGDSVVLGLTLVNLGAVLVRRSGFAQAQEKLESALVVFENLGHRPLESVAMSCLGEFMLREGPGQRVQRLLQHSVDFFLKHGFRNYACRALVSLGLLMVELREIARAQEIWKQAHAIQKTMGGRKYTELGVFQLEAFILWETGVLQAAEVRLGEAVVVAKSVNNVCVEVKTMAHLGALKADLGDVDEAKRILDDCDRLLEGHDLPTAEAAVQACRGILNMARARRAASSGEDDVARRENAKARQRLAQYIKGATLGPDSPLDYFSRHAARRLDQALADADRIGVRIECLDPEGTALFVDAECRCFRGPGRDFVDLSGKSKLRAILHTLVAARHDDQNSVTLEQLIASAWPDEKLTHESAKRRIHVAIATLRKLGLDAVLLRDSNGYALDPDVSLFWLMPDVFELYRVIQRLHAKSRTVAD